MYEPELHTDLEEISEDECLRILDRHKLGRLAIVVDGQPLIFPVNYALSQRVVTFRTAAGTKLANAPGTNVAFEIDEYDAGDSGGDALPHARPATEGISGIPGRRGMNHTEFEPIDPRLEQAVTEIRNDDVDPAALAAAADRVWARLVAVQKGDHIRGCADFQALIPEYRAGRLPATCR